VSGKLGHTSWARGGAAWAGGWGARRARSADRTQTRLDEAAGHDRDAASVRVYHWDEQLPFGVLRCL